MNLIYDRSINKNYTFATAQGWIDYAKTYGMDLFLYSHGASVTPTSSEVDLTIWQEILDYIQSNKIKVQSIDEWDKGLTNPRYTNTPITRTHVTRH